MRSLLFLLPFLSTLALAQAVAPPKLTREQNGRVTNYRAEGSLASTQAIGCIPLAKAKSSFTPPDLYLGVTECIARDNYDLAAGLFALAGIYGSFDAERVADKSAGQAKTVLVMNAFANVPQDKKTKFNETLNRIAKDPESLGRLCGEVRKVGMPHYYPTYMILHGIGAFTGHPNDAALLKDFDPQKAWVKLQAAYLHCPP
jgi:hypothetical protein